jgi:hypothetical protein
VQGTWKHCGRVYSCFVDFRKAHDLVHRDKLLECLCRLGVRGRMMGVLASMYWQAPMTVKNGGALGPSFCRLFVWLVCWCLLPPFYYFFFVAFLCGLCAGVFCPLFPFVIHLIFLSPFCVACLLVSCSARFVPMLAVTFYPSAVTLPRCCHFWAGFWVRLSMPARSCAAR